MENFKTLLENKNEEEIKNFMKNSKIDLLKSIGKRFKISISGKNKAELSSVILQAVRQGKSFHGEPSLAQMSVAQLRNKAVELNIDISGLKVKQALRVAILNKMNPSATSTSTSASAPTTLGSTMKNYDELKIKSLSYLKALAKQLKIKISKLSKEQLITSILEKAGSTSLPVLQEEPTQKKSDLSKLSKNVLLSRAIELGFDNTEPKKKVLKSDLVEYILSKKSSGASAVATVPPPPTTTTTELTFPISQSDLNKIKKALTIVRIKELLKKNSIKIPSGTTKKEDLVMLLLKIGPSSLPTMTPASPAPAPVPPPASATITDVAPPVVEEDLEIVALDDISSPFTPADINDLTEAPNEDQLREDIIRCLKFYEYPS